MQARIEHGAALARLAEGQNAARRLDVEATVIAFETSEVVGGDPMILGAEEQQRHGRVPREFEGLGKDQQHFAILVEKRAFDHVAG